MLNFRRLCVCTHRLTLKQLSLSKMSEVNIFMICVSLLSFNLSLDAQIPRIIHDHVLPRGLGRSGLCRGEGDGLIKKRRGFCLSSSEQCLPFYSNCWQVSPPPRPWSPARPPQAAALPKVPHPRLLRSHLSTPQQSSSPLQPQQYHFPHYCLLPPTEPHHLPLKLHQQPRQPQHLLREVRTPQPRFPPPSQAPDSPCRHHHPCLCNLIMI